MYMLSQRWTTAAQFSQVFRDKCYNDCTLSSTLPLVSMFSARKSEHLTPLLRELHWLKVWREFSSGYVFSHSVALMAWHPHTSLRPSTWLPTQVHVGVFGVLQRRRWPYRPHGTARWVNKHSRWLLLEHGILFHYLFVLCHHCSVPPRPEDGTVPVIVLFTSPAVWCNELLILLRCPCRITVQRGTFDRNSL